MPQEFCNFKSSSQHACIPKTAQRLSHGHWLSGEAAEASWLENPTRQGCPIVWVRPKYSIPRTASRCSADCVCQDQPGSSPLPQIWPQSRESAPWKGRYWLRTDERSLQLQAWSLKRRQPSSPALPYGINSPDLAPTLDRCSPHVVPARPLPHHLISQSLHHTLTGSQYDHH